MTRYVTLLSVVLALALTAALAACGSDEQSGGTGPDRTASTPTETPASPAQTPTTTGSGDAPTATDTPVPATATSPPAASGFAETDREALAALYNATNGEYWWDASVNWLSDAPLGEWEGVYHQRRRHESSGNGRPKAWKPHRRPKNPRPHVTPPPLDPCYYVGAGFKPAPSH